METGTYRHVDPVSLIYLPDDPRTKLKRCRLRKKAVKFTLFTGNRIDNGTACLVPSGARKLSAISALAKRFLQAASRLSNKKRQRSPVSAKIVRASSQDEILFGEDRFNIVRLVVPDFNRNNAIFS